MERLHFLELLVNKILGIFLIVGGSLRNHPTGIFQITSNGYFASISNYGTISAQSPQTLVQGQTLANYGNLTQFSLKFSTVENYLGTWEIGQSSSYDVSTVLIKGGVLIGSAFISGSIEHYDGSIDIGKKYSKIPCF